MDKRTIAKKIALLNENQDIRKMVVDYFKEKTTIDVTLKGFVYFADMVTLSLLDKSYSNNTIQELAPVISAKYGIKECSIQRQLRYACTITTNNKYKPGVLFESNWFTLKNKVIEMQKEKGV